jgi:hypothetical protein
MSRQTEFEFTLPVGYVDQDGNAHRQGVMRMATAMDEIAPLRDPRVRSNQAYLAIILLSRVIVKLGTLPVMSTGVIENLYVSDLAYLQALYRQINEDGKTTVAVTCPSCQTQHEVDLAELGGS